MSSLITDTELAEEFGLDLARFHRLRREKKWPCVKIDRTTFRFTPEQREQIIAMQSLAAGGTRTSLAPTGRSAARRRSA